MFGVVRSNSRVMLRGLLTISSNGPDGQPLPIAAGHLHAEGAVGGEGHYLITRAQVAAGSVAPNDQFGISHQPEGALARAHRPHRLLRPPAQRPTPESLRPRVPAVLSSTSWKASEPRPKAASAFGGLIQPLCRLLLIQQEQAG